MPRWTAADLPDLSGRVMLVTGGNSGIGLEAVRLLAGAGAAVTIACRDVRKGEAARADVRGEHPDAGVEVLRLDLADLGKVQAAAEAFSADHDHLDVLVNNAGVMALPYRETADGFEMQFGTNHLGHFAFTGHLLPLLLAGSDARVVTVASSAHRAGRINFDDLQSPQRFGQRSPQRFSQQSERGYARWAAYSQSKLANLLFTLELQRRCEAAGSDLRVVAAHPGYAATNLQQAGPRMTGNRMQAAVMGVGNLLFGQSAARGALPTVYAAVAPDVRGGDYIGPDGFMQMRGYPHRVTAGSAAYDAEAAQRLWEVSEELTGVSYSALAG